MPSTTQHSNAERKLVALPFKKSVAISYQSIKVRFFRSLITTISLVLAVSFLSYVQINTDIANGLLATGDQGIRQTMLRAGYDVPLTGDVISSPKQRWIVILSLLVCAVGIINAQLMAVTERFREIGTMKCLGALDRFIVRLFLLEAAMQGAAGATVGALAGAFFAIVGSIFRFGTIAFSAMPWGATFNSIGLAIVVGCMLSLIGVTYPAIMAAKMQPVEAMRAE